MGKLTPQLSSYLDFLRFIAALAVLLGHMELDGLYMAWFPLSEFSHEAVLLFFLLSGYIIYSTSQNRGPVDYVVARASRVYSVALPAILFCSFTAFFLPHITDTTQLSNYRPPEIFGIISSILFLNESWGNTAELSMNYPYWSLCYEVWYYIIFGAFLFLRTRWRWFTIVVLSLIAGPAIMALYPIWVLGAYLAALQSRPRTVKPTVAYTLFLGSVIIVAVINSSGIDAVVRLALHDNIPGFWRLDSSQRILTDFILGFCFAANLYSFPHVSTKIHGLFTYFRRQFKFLSSFSFTLYLFHSPFTQLGGYWFPNSEQSIAHSVTAAAVIVLICLAISYGTERQLNRWRRSLSRLMTGYRDVRAAC